MLDICGGKFGVRYSGAKTLNFPVRSQLFALLPPCAGSPAVWFAAESASASASASASVSASGSALASVATTTTFLTVFVSVSLLPALVFQPQ